METQSNLPDIVVRTLESIEKNFYVRGLYRINNPRPKGRGMTSRAWLSLVA